MSDHFANLRSEIRDGLTAQIPEEEAKLVRRLLARLNSPELEAAILGSAADGDQQVSHQGDRAG
jgi:hypothetical protein